MKHLLWRAAGASIVLAVCTLPCNAQYSAPQNSSQQTESAPKRRTGFSFFGWRQNPYTQYQPVRETDAQPESAQENTESGSVPAMGQKLEYRVEEVIPVDERPGPRAAMTIPAPNAPPGSVANLNRRINFPRDSGDDVDVLKLQIFLDYHGYSPGEIDGRWGYNTGRALQMYQSCNSLPATGQIDDRVLARLEQFGDGYLLDHQLTAEDVKGPFLYIPRNYHEQARLKWLPYESLTEKLAERFHCSQTLLRKLNPGMDLDKVLAGQRILAPNVVDGIDEQRGRVALIKVSKHNKWAEAFDSEGRFMFYFPSTLGSEYDPLPLGSYQVTGVDFNPPFKYQPKLFWDADPNEPEEMIPPGPNSPVGKVWIGTSRKSVGIHGTPNPENISRNTSHGCIRLTNWDAEQLAKRVQVGTKIQFVE